MCMPIPIHTAGQKCLHKTAPHPVRERTLLNCFLVIAILVEGMYCFVKIDSLSNHQNIRQKRVVSKSSRLNIEQAPRFCKLYISQRMRLK